MTAELTDTERALEELAHSPWEAIRATSRRIKALVQLEAEGLTGFDVALAMTPVLEIVAYLLEARRQGPTHGAEGMGARLVERAMGPSTEELVEVLSATQKALDNERGRVANVARLALQYLALIPDDVRYLHEEEAMQLRALVEREEPEHSHADLMEFTP